MGAEFLSRLERGDVRSAAKWLVIHHGAEVLSLCRAMVRDSSTAEDLAQDAFSRAFTGLADYRGEASPRTWLMTIARHRCIDHLRRQRVQPWEVTEEPEPDQAPDAEPLPAALLSNRELVARGLGALDETHRALVVLRYRHGMDYAELAAAFGLKPGTVRMRVSRALARMRATLEEPQREELRLEGLSLGAAPEPPAAAAAPTLTGGPPRSRARVAKDRSMPAGPPAPAAAPAAPMRASAPAPGGAPPSASAPRAPAAPARQRWWWPFGKQAAAEPSEDAGRWPAEPPGSSAAGTAGPGPSPEDRLAQQLRALDAPLEARVRVRLEGLIDTMLPEG